MPNASVAVIVRLLGPGVLVSIAAPLAMSPAQVTEFVHEYSASTTRPRS